MSEHHPVLPIESLSHRHPSSTPAIAAVCLHRSCQPTNFDREDRDESIALLREARSP